SLVNVSDTVRRFAFTLVPIGVAMWAAHLLYHLATATVMPPWLTAAQIGILDAGLLLTLYIGWRVALQYGTRIRTAISLVIPWAAVSCALYAAGIWILFQPMQMRGVMN
ncbi:MAG: hypothetical protein WB992_00855, partial [Bryobacteraceae bacterium]